MRIRKIKLSIIFLLPLITSISAYAQSEIDTEAAEAIYLELGRGAPKTETQTTSPIDVIEAWELERSGITETGRLLQRLATSFNFSTSTISDGSDIVRPGTLRGMGPDQLLVLINGKRRHSSALVHINGSIGRGSAGVDFNAIPVSSIERIEILRDGAAAQYGSDAIAGVINIILKSATNKTDVRLVTGVTDEGDGAQLTGSINYGTELGDDGYFNITLEKRDRDKTNRAGLDPRQQYAALSDSSLDPREDTFNRLNHVYGDAESDNISVFINTALPITDSGEIYAFGGISRREGTSRGFYRRSQDNRNIPEIYADGFLPLINTEIDDYSLALGYRHTFANDWQIDSSVITGGNSFNFNIKNSLNISFGPNTPLQADAGTLKFDQTTVNIDITGTIDVGGQSPIYSSFGLEYREDNYEIEAGELVSFANGPDDNIATAFANQSGGVAAPGIQVFPGFRPSNEVNTKRDNWALYSEFEYNIVEAFLLGFAARFESYSDVGDNITGKLSARYQISDRLALRGSFSSGFRAPSGQQANFNTVNTQFIDDGSGGLIGVEVGTFGNDSDVARALGVPNLDEETSLSSGFGVVITPTDNFIITTDLYRIEIKDRIVLSGIFRPEIGGGPIASALDPFGIGGAQFFSNAIDTTTEGMDIVSTYKLSIGSGRLYVSSAAHWNTTEIQGGIIVPSGLDSATLFNRVEQVRLEKSQPKQRYSINLSYQQGPLFLTLRSNYFGRVTSTESATDVNRDQTFGSKWVSDIMASYTIANKLTWSIGADNLFDETPDQNKAGESFNGIFTFNRRTTPFGYNGTFYYTSLGYEF